MLDNLLNGVIENDLELFIQIPVTKKSTLSQFWVLLCL